MLAVVVSFTATNWCCCCLVLVSMLPLPSPLPGTIAVAIAVAIALAIAIPISQGPSIVTFLLLFAVVSCLCSVFLLCHHCLCHFYCHHHCYCCHLLLLLLCYCGSPTCVFFSKGCCNATQRIPFPLYVHQYDASTCMTFYPTKVEMIYINTFLILMGMTGYVEMIYHCSNL